MFIAEITNTCGSAADIIIVSAVFIIGLWMMSKT